MTNKYIKDYCKNCDVEPPAMRFKCPECEHNPDKEQIMIDGIQFNKFGDFYVDYDLSGKFQSISSSAKEYKILKSLIKQFARKTKECESLKEIKLKLELNENHNKNEIKKLKKRIRKDREFFKNKISSLTLARKEFLEALDHFNWQIGLVKNDRYRKALEEIEKIVNEPCVADAQEDCKHCDFWCEHKDILNIINKAKEQL